MQAYEAIGETLKRLGVKTFFGLMGDGNMRFIAHAADSLGLAYYGSRHECGAVAMADGFSRAGNQVGVCTVTQGPGVTNAMTALAEAAKGGSPLLLLAGDTPTRALRHNQDIDQSAVLNSIGVGVQRVRGAPTIVLDIVKAWNRAILESRPIALSIPTDVQVQPCPEEALVLVKAQSVARPRPEDEAIEAVCRLIAKCERPVILAGRGATRSRAREALEALGERIGALFATSVQAKGFFAGHPFDAGISGGFASEAACRLLERADLVLAFGTSLNQWVTRNREQFSPSAKIVQVDARPAAIGALIAPDCGIVGDAAVTAQALARELERAGVKIAGFRSPALREEIESLRGEPAFEDQSGAATIDPRALMRRVQALLPAARTVVVDSGHSMGWSTQLLSVPDANGFIFSNDFQAVGLGLATAFGAAIARPDRLTVCAPGDGGFMMGLCELETIVRYGVPMLVLVINDAAYGVEVHILRNLKQPETHAKFPDVDFAAVAKGFGARALTVRKTEDLDGVREWLAAPRGTMLLDCKVNPDVLGGWFKENITPGSWFMRMARH